MKSNPLASLASLVTLILIPASGALGNWGPDQRLTSDGSSSLTSWNGAWCVAAADSAVHVVWYDFRDGQWEIYYKRSLDNGASWEADRHLTSGSIQSTFPAVAARDSLVHVVWAEFDGRWGISYRRSADRGATWEDAVRLAVSAGSGTTYYPSVAAEGSCVHVVWQDSGPGNDEIYYLGSLDNGSTWSGRRLTVTDDPSKVPSVAASSTFVHVVWQEWPSSACEEIHYLRSTDLGLTWVPEETLAAGESPATNPSVAADGSVVHVVWSDARETAGGIYWRGSGDDGATWKMSASSHRGRGLLGAVPPWRFPPLMWTLSGSTDATAMLRPTTPDRRTAG
ncbi:MAG: exo-alpha-sialidase [Ignavibacteriaceae bacterium]|nr:exo-alpha-sialidase [Ignavibacteriaceae bacterium]